MQLVDAKVGTLVGADRGVGYVTRYLHGSIVSEPVIILGQSYVQCLWMNPNLVATTTLETVANLRPLGVDADGYFVLR